MHLTDLEVRARTDGSLKDLSNSAADLVNDAFDVGGCQRLPRRGLLAFQVLQALHVRIVTPSTIILLQTRVGEVSAEIVRCGVLCIFCRMPL